MQLPLLLTRFVEQTNITCFIKCTERADGGSCLKFYRPLQLIISQRGCPTSVLTYVRPLTISRYYRIWSDFFLNLPGMFSRWSSCARPNLVQVRRQIWPSSTILYFSRYRTFPPPHPPPPPAPRNRWRHFVESLQLSTPGFISLKMISVRRLIRGVFEKFCKRIGYSTITRFTCTKPKRNGWLVIICFVYKYWNPQTDRVVRRCCVSYITGASNWYWLTVGQGLLSL